MAKIEKTAVLIVLGFSFFMASNAFGKPLELDDFLSHMTTTLPTMFCQEDQIFRQCTQITKESCVDLASVATMSCIKKIKSKMPEQITSVKDSADWGRQIGSCAGGDFVRTLQATQPDQIDLPCIVEKEKKMSQSKDKN